MLIPEIQPDEFGYGYLIRLSLLNGVATKHHAERVFSDGTGRGAIPRRIAEICGKDVEKYCQQHTLLPAYRAFSASDDETNHGSLDNLYAIKRFGYLGFTNLLKVCRTCIREDLDYLGYSYYRRSHQIPGVCVCSKHNNEPDEGQLFCLPVEAFSNPDMVNLKDSRPTTLHKNPIINRYREIQDALCQFKKPIAVDRIIDDLQAKAREKGLRWSRSGRNVLFSNYLIENVPSDWLSEIVPAISHKIRGKKIPSLDGVLTPQRQAFSSKIYVLAIAALFEDADEALFVIHQSANKNARKRRTGHRYESKNIDLASIKKVYLASGGLRSVIAKDLGVSLHVVERTLRAEGLPALGNRSAETIEGFILFANGASIADACEISGASQHQIESFLREGSANLCKLITEMQSPHWKHQDHTIKSEKPYQVSLKDESSPHYVRLEQLS